MAAELAAQMPVGLPIAELPAVLDGATRGRCWTDCCTGWTAPIDGRPSRRNRPSSPQRSRPAPTPWLRRRRGCWTRWRAYAALLQPIARVSPPAWTTLGLCLGAIERQWHAEAACHAIAVRLDRRISPMARLASGGGAAADWRQISAGRSTACLAALALRPDDARKAWFLLGMLRRAEGRQLDEAAAAFAAAADLGMLKEAAFELGHTRCAPRDGATAAPKQPTVWRCGRGRSIRRRCPTMGCVLAGGSAGLRRRSALLPRGDPRCDPGYVRIAMAQPRHRAAHARRVRGHGAAEAYRRGPASRPRRIPMHALLPGRGADRSRAIWTTRPKRRSMHRAGAAAGLRPTRISTAAWRCSRPGRLREGLGGARMALARHHGAARASGGRAGSGEPAVRAAASCCTPNRGWATRCTSSRYAPLLAARGARVILEVQRPLRPPDARPCPGVEAGGRRRRRRGPNSTCTAR